MTERRPLPRPPRARVVVMPAFALFAVVAVLLAMQMRAGRDPALSGQAAGAQQPGLVRRVIVRRVVVTEVRRVGDNGVAAPPTVAPPAAAPVPAPAPALATRAS